MRKLILMRGLPGSGKSTMARKLAADHIQKPGSSVVICSTDGYFINSDGEYVFDHNKLGYYHGLNQRRAYAMMSENVELVIIDNTNVTRKDMAPYIASANQFDYEVEEIIVGKDRLLPSLDEADIYRFEDYIDLCHKRNTHKVPREAILRMARRFEE